MERRAARPAGYSAYGGSTYGSVTAPVDLGSGGGSSYSPGLGGAGGGAIRLNVTGRAASGREDLGGRRGGDQRRAAAAARAGRISLTVGTLAGSGTISANGGMGNSLGGGGGGGRIAILYGVYDFSGSSPLMAAAATLRAARARFTPRPTASRRGWSWRTMADRPERTRLGPARAPLI